MTPVKLGCGNWWRFFLLSVGLASSCLKAANSLLVQAIRDKAPIEEVKALIRLADEASRRAALFDIVRVHRDDWFYFNIFSELLEAQSYEQELLDKLLSAAIPAKTFFFLNRLIGKWGVKPTVAQKTQLQQNFDRTTLLQFAIVARDRQWARELLLKKVSGFGDILMEAIDEERGFLEALLPYASQENLDDGMWEALGARDEPFVIALEKAGAHFPTVDDLFTPGRPVFLGRPIEIGGETWRKLAQVFVDRGMVSSIELIEQALLKDFPLPSYFALAGSLFGEPRSAIEPLLQRVNEQKNKDLLHKIVDKRVVHSSRLAQYSGSWLREAFNAEVSSQLPESYQPREWFVLPPGRATSIDTSLRHFPVSFLIDQQEGIIGSSQELGEQIALSVSAKDAIVNELHDMVVWDRRLIIASKGLTCSLLSVAYTHRGGEYDVMKQRVNTNWKLYSVPGTQFTIWIHNEYAEYYAQILNIDRFKRLLTSTKEEVLQYCPSAVVKKDDPRIQVKQYNVHDLERIFKPNESIPKDAVIDLYLSGHGESGELMAGLPISKEFDEGKRITSLLTFFGKKLNTGVVYISSCNAGGRNTTLLQTKNDGIALDYNYILIIGAVTDKPTAYFETISLPLMDNFFTQAARIAWDKNAWVRLLKAVIGRISIGRDAISGYENFPQVWLPNQLGFQSPDVHRDVLVVGKVVADVHGQSGDAILVDGRLAVLWYSRALRAPVLVSWVRPAPMQGLTGEQAKLRLTRWKDVSTLDELVGGRIDQVIASSVLREQFPVLAHFFNQEHALAWVQDEKNILYPEFVSMDRSTPRRLWFKRIELSDAGNPFMGILRFLRDAFLHIGVEPKDILIEELEGLNDFPIRTEAARLSERVHETYPLEELMRPTAGQRITLRNVMVRINSSEYPDEIVLYIEYGGRYWSYRLEVIHDKLWSVPAGIWHFRETEAPPIEEFKQALAQDMPPAEQKTAYEVTKEKFERLKRGMGPEQWTEFKGRLYPKLPETQPAVQK